MDLLSSLELAKGRQVGRLIDDAVIYNDESDCIRLRKRLASIMRISRAQFNYSAKQSSMFGWLVG